MKEISISSNEAGQRLDKLLAKYMREAPKSFFYKMMRKKNITLNGKKAQGNEILACGDVVKLFLADETIAKFQGGAANRSIAAAARSSQRASSEKAAAARSPQRASSEKAAAVQSSQCVPSGNAAAQLSRRALSENAASAQRVPDGRGASGRPHSALDIIYEDEHIVLINKPAGMLSQKAKPQDVSLVEYLTEHLLDNGSLTAEELQLFRPGVCNRLDRNTSGLVVAGKSLIGLQTMSRLLQERTVRKYYRCIAAGTMEGSAHLKGYLTKDCAVNRVRISDTPQGPDDKPIETEYTALVSRDGLTMLEVHLITGRSHQIRAHLSSIGHPIIGDMKYGDERINRRYRESYGVRSQLLHAYRLEFPEMEGALAYLSGRSFCAELPAIYSRLLPVQPDGKKFRMGKYEICSAASGKHEKEYCPAAFIKG